jgi:hypothetical protein
MTNTVFEFELNNARNKQLALSIEPWGDVVRIGPKESLRMRVEGPASDDPSRCLIVRVENDGNASVFGWSGSSITVLTT